MLALLALLFIALPLLELAVIVQVSRGIGLGDTIVLLVLVSVAGAFLVKREGLGVARRVQQQLDRGVVPGRELADGLLILVGGALMLTPGFITDVVGLSLLLPPVRALLRAGVLRQFRRRAVVITRGQSGPRGPFIDVDPTYPPEDPRR